MLKSITMRQQIQISDHFTYHKLLKFVMPSIVMMVFSSIYGIVDGIFVSNYAGKMAFAGVNFIMPPLQILSTFGFMLGTGGTALIAKTYGEGNKTRANQIFSMIIYVTLVAGLIISIGGLFLLKPVCILMGAEGELLDYSLRYGKTILIGSISFMLQMEFQSILPASEKPKLGLWFTVGAGVANMLLDWLFVGVFRWSVEGAAWATIVSQMIGGLGPLLYYILPNSSLFRIGKPYFDGKALLKICFNGSSELMSNLSMSLVGMLYNVQLLKYARENGVAAYGAIMYINFVFISAFIGYSVGSAPIVSYNYGAKDEVELRSMFKKSMTIIMFSSVGMVVLALLLKNPMASIFTGYDATLFALTKHAFTIQAFSYLFAGICIYGSSFFTALNNGLISALISFLRALVFQTIMIMVLPLIYGVEGIWYSTLVAEIFAVSLTLIFLVTNNKRYHYFK